MITKQDLDSAIAECQGDPNPNAQTCIKLASYYTINEHLFGNHTQMYEEPKPQFSMNSGVVTYESESEFSKAISGKDLNDVLPLIDELMETLAVLHPKLYKSVLRRLE